MFANKSGGDNKEKATLFQKNLQEFIVSENALANMDVEIDLIDMSLIYTENNTHVQQTPHTDYKLVAATKEDIKKKINL